MNNEPLISVIIAIYNPGKYLRSCLDSIVNQTYRNLEIILVDDGSTDDSLKICQEYAEKDSRVIVYHKENSGVSATRNQGIRLAHGDYFSFIDSDDYIEPDTYEYLLNIINEHNVDVVNYEHFITKAGKDVTRKLPENNYGMFDKHGAMYQFVHNVPFAWNKLFSKKCIEGLSFDETICRGEDCLFSRIAIDKVESVWFDSRPLYHYVQSEESAVRGKFRRSQLTGIKLIDIYDSFFKEKYPELYDDVIINQLYLIVTLYYDMYMDEEKFTEERKMLYKKFKAFYPKVNLNKSTRTKAKRCKFFRFSPAIYCFVRKVASFIRG